MNALRFYLGAHHPHWLARTEVPLFISHRALARRSRLPRACGPWALDSGGFTELSMFGAWQTTPQQYVAAVRRYRDEIGCLDWAAPQDYMCEPFMLAKTGLPLREHLARTVGNFERLRELAPDLPFIPVLQGWSIGDYLDCLARYQNAGIDLTAYPTVGLGSVGRRQATSEIATITATLAAHGLKLHGFGVKTQGLASYAEHLVSADSMAWSLRGRRTPGCTPTHKNEANCLPFALTWRARIAALANGPRQLTLPAA